MADGRAAAVHTWQARCGASWQHSSSLRCLSSSAGSGESSDSSASASGLSRALDEGSAASEVEEVPYEGLMEGSQAQGESGVDPGERGREGRRR